jgi:serine/threonine protein phosphatase PrpC
MREHQSTVANDTSGCTACVAVVTPTHIVCANAGDTRCIMACASTVKELSFDHKPSHPAERRRIERADGHVQYDRVDGDLAVSRAFGDFQFKNCSRYPASEQRVSCIPDVIIHERTPVDNMVMIACDGFWDVNTNSVAVQYINSLFADGEANVVKIAEELVDVAFEKGNVSLIYFTD